MTASTILPTLLGSRIDIPGTTNLRDLGGYPAAGDRVIRSGVLFRAEALAYPGPDVGRVALWDERQRDRYRSLGLALVLDLRAPHERDAAPSAWADASGATLMVVSINEGGEGDGTDYVRRLRQGSLRSFTADDLAAYYASTLRRRADQFGRGIAAIAAPGGVPALVHCAAGKDRTGLLIALILDVLGVARDVIVADYALTGVFRPRRVDAYADVLAASGIEPAAVSALFETPAEAMDLALASIDTDFGSVREFLIRHGGIGPEVFDDLAATLLTDTQRGS
jgi:protein-tyrosine phosphatase